MKREILTATVYELDGTPRTITPTGREAWALRELIQAGARGCTPIDNPAPRWSAYIHDLRHEFGLYIETIHEKHGGDFPGTHARYVLRSQVAIERRAA